MRLSLHGHLRCRPVSCPLSATIWLRAARSTRLPENSSTGRATSRGRWVGCIWTLVTRKCSSVHGLNNSAFRRNGSHVTFFVLFRFLRRMVRRPSCEIRFQSGFTISMLSATGSSGCASATAAESKETKDCEFMPLRLTV